jgi:DNA polymerase III subunit delta'
MISSAPESLPLDSPEANAGLVGHDDAERTLLDAYRSGRIHHAWILQGPYGIGKATLAYRFARFLLAHPDPAGADARRAKNLAVAPDSPFARQIAARSHPNLTVLQRPRDEDGNPSATIIPVDAVRRVGRFLGTTAATDGWRIVIVDAADDLNRASANALLKMLEEPPEYAIFLLVSHVPGRLLPTIRSRCRRLALKPLAEVDLSALLAAAGPADGEEDLARAIRLAEGSVGRALEFLSKDGQETARDVLDFLDRLPHYDRRAMQALAERLGRRGGEAGYRLGTALLLDWISARARTAARSGAHPAQLAPWSEVWEKVSRALAETETYNLDRTQTLLTAFRTVSVAAVQNAAHA